MAQQEIAATKDDFIEKLVAVNRVAKVVKGGRQFGFTALTVVGDGNGYVGSGVGKATEIPEAISKGIQDAKKNLIHVPIDENGSIPHDILGTFGSANVLLKRAPEGTGVIAGGAVRIVLEMAGVDNALGKQLGSKNALNNARATVVAVQKMRQFEDVARQRGIPMEELWK